MDIYGALGVGLQDVATDWVTSTFFEVVLIHKDGEEERVGSRYLTIESAFREGLRSLNPRLVKDLLGLMITPTRPHPQVMEVRRNSSMIKRVRRFRNAAGKTELDITHNN